MTTSTLNPTVPVIIASPQAKPHPEVTRLLAAAVVDRPFRQRLLRNPLHALETGYQGENFSFSNEERVLIASIRADTLAELATELISALDLDKHTQANMPYSDIRRSFVTAS
jgi:hypothetical protein